MRASHTDIANSVVVLIRMRNTFSASNSVAYVVAVLMNDTFSASVANRIAIAILMNDTFSAYVANIVTLYVDMRTYAKFTILSVAYAVVIGIDMDYTLSASEFIADVVVVCVYV